MKTKEFKANVAYLDDAGVGVSDSPTWDKYPYSRELYLSTDAGGDFSICVEELSRERVLEYLDDYDVNEETLTWWGTKGLPFDNIHDLYMDILKWRDDFREIAYGMPY